MTGQPPIDWAILALSLFNTIIMLWLGLTVLLNADRRHLGVWLMGGGLLAGALFFIAHTAILGQELTMNADGLNFWWQLGWLPVTVAPFAWYVVVLWYSGFWSQPRPVLYRRHRLWLIGLSGCAALFVLLLLIAQPIPAYEQIVQLDLSGALVVGGVPLLLVALPPFMLLCIGLSLDALIRPAPAPHPNGEHARARSRPWLLSAAAVLMLVCVLVAVFIAGVIQQAFTGRLGSLPILDIGLFDLLLSGLIALATTLLGQAVVAYEVFTGKALPRRGLTRGWRSLLLLAAGYAGVVGGALAYDLRPIYSLLLTTGLMVVFYALYTWRSFVERERWMATLRPFVRPQGLVQGMVEQNGDTVSRANTLFAAVCADVLGTTQAQLTPLGPFAPLAGEGLVYPSDAPRVPVNPAGLGAAVTALAPPGHGGYSWAVPLWAERGLSGVLLLGEKRDGGLYAQEEIEIAQRTGERLVDMLAGEAMAARLMAIQRERVRAERVLDLGTRRTLHDETLPALHTAILHLSHLTQPEARDAVTLLKEAHGQIADLIRRESAAPPAPVMSSLFGERLRAGIEREFAGAFERIIWQGADSLPLDGLEAEVVAGAVREVVRNAARHGRGDKPDRPLTLTIILEGVEESAITICDNGVGMMQDTMSNGNGLALHRALLAVIGGSLSTEVGATGGTSVKIVVQTTSVR
jgi:signal transduction histidine kinase